MTSQETGIIGEKLAANYLTKKGYKILAKNFKRKIGEIDIVARKKGIIVFVEVKTLNKLNKLSGELFYPEDKITAKKKIQLRKMALVYLNENKIPLTASYQIDIIAIEIGPDFQKKTIRHYQNAIADKF